jgi:hypothetical protein
LAPHVQDLKTKADQFDRAYKKLQATQKEAAQITSWMEKRYYWGDVLMELRRVLIRSEDDVKKKLSVQRPGVEAGIWIEQLTIGVAQTPATGHGGTPVPVAPVPSPGEGDAPAATANPVATANPAANTITLICRAVNLSSVDSAANTDIAYAVLKAFQEDPLFDPKTTQLRGDITPDDVTGTFTFGITVGLQNPLNL